VNQGSSVSEMTRLRTERPRLESQFKRLYRLWGPPRLLYNGGGGIAAGPWSWPLTSVHCRDKEWVEQCSTPPYVFMAWFSIKHRDNFAVLPLRLEETKTRTGLQCLDEK